MPVKLEPGEGGGAAVLRHQLESLSAVLREELTAVAAHLKDNLPKMQGPVQGREGRP